MNQRARWGDPRALLVESLVVISSILIAFALDAWWEQQGEEAREQAVLEGVLEDLRANQRQREARIDLGRRSLAARTTLVEALESGPRDGRVVVADTVAAAALIFPTCDPLTSALDGLLASDGFAGLTDIEVQRRLAEWRQMYDEIHEDQELMLDLLRPLAEALTTQNPLPPDFWDFTPWVQTGASAGRSLTVPRESPSLSAALGLKISFLNNIVSGLESLGDIETDLIVRLERRLGPA